MDIAKRLELAEELEFFQDRFLDLVAMASRAKAHPRKNAHELTRLVDLGNMMVNRVNIVKEEFGLRRFRPMKETGIGGRDRR